MNFFKRLLFTLIFIQFIDVGSTGTLIHRDSVAATLNQFKRAKTVVQRSLTFHKSITTPSSSSSSFSGAPVQANNPSLLDYMMLIQIGNSSVPPVWVTIDTSGFFSWVLCSPCYPFSFTCSYNLSFNYQVATEYNCSATLKCPDIYQVSCYNDYCFSGYIYTADYGALPDYVLSDVISLSPSLTYPLVYIGCLVVTNTGPYPLGNAYGSFSLGKHPLSLVNQIGVRSFTYCLQYLSSAENSTIYFGDDAKIWVPLVSTPFYNLDSTVYYFTPLYNSGSSGYYWLTLLSFTVGPQIIDFPGATPQTGGNVIIEPSTLLTSLPTNMVAEIVDAIAGFMHFPRAYTLEAELGLSLCYNVTNSADWYLSTPLFLANFVGGSLPLLFENIFFQVESGIQCLTIIGGYYDYLVGSGLQANFNVEYDLADNLIKFQPNINCASPPL